MTRSEFTAHQHLNPATLQAMRNLSALQRMQRDGWTVGRTFTQPGRGHVAPRITIEDDVRALRRAIGIWMGTLCATGFAFVFLVA